MIEDALDAALRERWSDEARAASAAARRSAGKAFADQWAKHHPAPVNDVAGHQTLRYFNMRKGGFTKAAKAAFLKVGNNRQLAKNVNDRWTARYGTASERRAATARLKAQGVRVGRSH